jgi:hypothetical protein
MAVAVLVTKDEVVYGLVTDRDLVIRAVAEAKPPDAPAGPLSSSDAQVTKGQPST